MDNGQTDGQFYKGQAHNQRIGSDADKERADYILLDLKNYFFGTGAQLTQTKAHKLVVIHCDKKCGDNQQHQLDKAAGYCVSQTGEIPHSADGKAGYHIPQRRKGPGEHISKIGYKGRIQLGHPAF